MHSDLPNICSTCISSLSWDFVFSLLMENELYLPTVYACLCFGSWGLLKWITLEIFKRQYMLANKFLESRSRTPWMGFFLLDDDILHHTWQLTYCKLLPSRSNHLSQPWNDGHYVNPYIWDFYVITEEAVCITVHFITIPFERLSHWGMVLVSPWFSVSKEENIMSFKPLQKSNLSTTKNY